MIWPFKPRSPLSLLQKVNAERRFATSARLVGRQCLSNCTVLVAQDLDPIIGEHDKETLLPQLLGFVQSRFPIRDLAISVSWWDEESDVTYSSNNCYAIQMPGDSPVEIVVHPQLAELPYCLAGVLAVACSEILVQKESLAAEPLPLATYETLPVLFGFGPVMTDIGLYRRGAHNHAVEFWEGDSLGAITAFEYGYSMALADWSLKTSHGEVAEAMHVDAKGTYTQGIRFLQKTADCYFDADVFNVPASQDIEQLRSRLDHSHQSTRLGTLQDLMQEKSIPKQLYESVANQVRHGEEMIQVAGAFALARCRDLPRTLHDDLLITVETSPVTLKRAAMLSLRPGYENDDAIVESVTELLGKTDSSTAAVCAVTLLKYENYPDNLDTSLLRALSRMVLKSGPEELQAGVRLLQRVSSQPMAVLNEHFEDDPSAKSIFAELLADMDSTAGETVRKP